MSQSHGTTIMGFRNDLGFVLAHDGFITSCPPRYRKGNTYTITQVDSGKYYELAPPPNAIGAVICGDVALMSHICKKAFRVNQARLNSGKPRLLVCETAEYCRKMLLEITKKPEFARDLGCNGLILGGFDGNSTVLYNVSQHSAGLSRHSKRSVANRFNGFCVFGGDEATKELIENFKVDNRTSIPDLVEVIKYAMYDASLADRYTGGLVKAILHTRDGRQQQLLMTVDKSGRSSEGMFVEDIAWEIERQRWRELIDQCLGVSKKKKHQ